MAPDARAAVEQPRAADEQLSQAMVAHAAVDYSIRRNDSAGSHHPNSTLHDIAEQILADGPGGRLQAALPATPALVL
ncbi:hypothetical protein [Streptomyces sp. SAS_276]|uniref:hypothetical protein n=1 Tax=Streptomyces sp. SAS_276 TaxID=3412745 RepID=UPI00403C08EA